MQRFHCSCGAEIFFENSHCVACGTVLGFDPKQQRLLALSGLQADKWFAIATGQQYKLCGQQQALACNWLIPGHQDETQCLSCRLTRTIPILTFPRNRTRWQRLEQTKRMAIYTLLRLGLPFNSWANAMNQRLPMLIFDFLEDHQSNSEIALEFVYSGHSNGVITINVAEADDSFRAANREMMNEVYRTLLGHFRHELGHYFGLLFKHDSAAYDEYQRLFGDDNIDYNLALERYYSEGVREDWRENYISAYASAHPQEDWAETWAHYLHIRETLETARYFKVMSRNKEDGNFQADITDWVQLTIILNALNRSMGIDDAYPFVITPVIGQKLSFIDRLVKAWQVTGHNAVKR